MAQSIVVTVNGAPREIGGGLCVSDLLLELGLKPAKVAVERNLEIVPRSRFAETPLAGGDRLEIVEFVGGG